MTQHMCHRCQKMRAMSRILLIDHRKFKPSPFSRDSRATSSPLPPTTKKNTRVRPTTHQPCRKQRRLSHNNQREIALAPAQTHIVHLEPSIIAVAPLIVAWSSSRNQAISTHHRPATQPADPARVLNDNQPFLHIVHSKSYAERFESITINTGCDTRKIVSIIR